MAAEFDRLFSDLNLLRVIGVYEKGVKHGFKILVN